MHKMFHSLQADLRKTLDDVLVSGKEITGDTHQVLVSTFGNAAQVVKQQVTEFAEGDLVHRLPASAQELAQNTREMIQRLPKSREVFAFVEEHLVLPLEEGLEPRQAPACASDTSVDGLDRLSQALPKVLLQLVCHHLELHDIGSLRSTCWSLHHALNPMSHEAKSVFQRFWAKWETNNVPKQHIHVSYLSCRLARETNELVHWRAIVRLLTEVKKLDKGLVVDLVGNVGRFPSRAIAEAVTKRRSVALSGVIVTHASVGQQFRKVASSYSRSVSFMIENTPAECAAPRPPISAPGFLGYACDLLELRTDEERLRNTVLACYVYRDLTVWETREDVQRALVSGQYVSRDPFFCTLEDTLHRRGDGATATWGEFRPRLEDIVFPNQVVQDVQDRVASLEFALVNSMI